MLKRNKLFLSAVHGALIISLLLIFGLYTYFSFSLLKKHLFLAHAVRGLGILFSLLAISSNLSEKAKCSWVFILLTVPVIGIPAFFMSKGNSISKKRKIFIKSLIDKKPKTESFESKIVIKSKYNFTYFKEIANCPNVEIFKNTSAEYFAEGKDMFRALSEDIERARSFIFLEFYIVAAGEAFGSMLDILSKKAKNGVEVRIIYDGLGSLLRLPREFTKIMKESEITAISHPPFSLKLPHTVNNRNHRKIAIIDGEIAYTGGINLADEYVYSKARLGRWKDSAVRLRGECVNSLTHTFLSDFAFLSGNNEDFSKYYKYRKKKCPGDSVVFSDGPLPLYEQKSAKRIILSMLDAAEKHFIFTTPYLICDSEIFNALKGAIVRGVKVCAVIPKKPDKYLIAILSRRYAQQLLSLGARVYLYTPGFMHSKIYLCDEKFLMLGTVNFDYRSLLHNFENGILFAEHKVISDAKKDIEAIISDSEPYEKKKESIPRRLICSILEIFAPLL